MVSSMFRKSYMTGITSGTGNVYSSRAHEFIPVLNRAGVAQSLVYKKTTGLPMVHTI
jgi:hypothetical protein